MNRRSFAPLTMLAIAALGLAACSSGEDAAPSTEAPATQAATTTVLVTTTTTPPRTTTTTSTTTTTIDPFTVDQAVYFVAVAEFNPALEQLNDRYNADGGTSWSQIPAYCAEFIELDAVFFQVLDDHDWTPEVQPAIDKLIASEVAAAQYWHECATSPGTASAQAPIEEDRLRLDDRVTEAASAVRYALDLPINRWQTTPGLSVFRERR